MIVYVVIRDIPCGEKEIMGIYRNPEDAATRKNDLDLEDCSDIFSIKPCEVR